MKNADKPANPVECTMHEGKFHGVQTGQSSGYETGLTKREFLAGLAMQGLLANPTPGSHRIPNQLCGEALQYADELLKALENENP